MILWKGFLSQKYFCLGNLRKRGVKWVGHEDKAQLCHFLWLWASGLTSMSLSFLLYKVVVRFKMIIYTVYRNRYVCIYAHGQIYMNLKVYGSLQRLYVWECVYDCVYIHIHRAPNTEHLVWVLLSQYPSHALSYTVAFIIPSLFWCLLSNILCTEIKEHWSDSNFCD